MKVKILGGAGAVGAGVARDLLRNPEVEEVVLADLNEKAAREAVEEIGDRRVRWEPFRAEDNASLAGVMDRGYIIANCVGPHYRYCRPIAEAALAAGADYCDICDDYDAAEAVLGLDAEARKTGVAMITCLGTSPGMTNMLAKRGSELLEKTDEIHTAWTVGGSDPTGPSELYHLAHICSGTVPQFLAGKEERVPALSGVAAVEFPEPVGRLQIAYIGHSEPVTLPRYIEGVKTVTNRGGLYPGPLNDPVRFIRETGLFEDHLVTVGGTEITPRDFTVAHIRHLMEHLPGALGLEETEPVSVFRVEVVGRRDGAPCTIVYTGTNEVVTTTARSLSIGIQALGSGEARRPGVLAPEACLPAQAFLDRMADGGGMTLRREVRSTETLIS